MPSPALLALTMTRVSSRWWGLPLLRILLPLLTLLACCFCRHLRSWMLQGLKLLLGWSISSFSAETQPKGAQCPIWGWQSPRSAPVSTSATCAPRNNTQWFLAGLTSPSLVPTGITSSPGSILPLPLHHWAELPAALGKFWEFFLLISHDLQLVAMCLLLQGHKCTLRVLGSGSSVLGLAVPLPAPCHRVLTHSTGAPGLAADPGTHRQRAPGSSRRPPNSACEELQWQWGQIFGRC